MSEVKNTMDDNNGRPGISEKKINKLQRKNEEKMNRASVHCETSSGVIHRQLKSLKERGDGTEKNVKK